MRPVDPSEFDPERVRPEERGAFLRGVVYGFQIGREYGWEEGVKAMRTAIVKVLQARGKNGGA